MGPKNKSGEPPEVTIGDHLMKFDAKKTLANPSPGEKFLVLHRNDGNETMATVSPFVLRKCIDGVCGIINNITCLRDGTVLIHTKNAKQAARLIQLTQINSSTHIKVSEHVRLNSAKGVIFKCHQLTSMTDDEILQELNDQDENLIKVLEIKRITRKNGQNEIPTGTFFVTFGSPTLPEAIYAGYTRIQVNPYIPNPMICYNCFQYNHYKDNCPTADKKICLNCSGPFHTTEEDKICKKPPKCVNCGQSHASTSKQCPVFKKHKEIQTIKVLERVPFHKATNLYNERHPTFSNSYASVVRPGKSCSCICKCSLTPPDPPQESIKKPDDSTILPTPPTGATPNLQKRSNPNRDSSASSSTTELTSSKTIYNKDGSKGRIVDRKQRSTNNM